jgi:hypothetical protein
MDGDAKRVIERLREITAKIGVPVNLPAGREIEIHAKPGEVPVMRFDKAGAEDSAEERIEELLDGDDPIDVMPTLEARMLAERILEVLK